MSMPSEEVIRMLRLGGLLLATMLTACVNRFDPELQAYLAFKRDHRAGLVAAYNRQPDAKKIELFFGAMTVHPPDTEINSAVAAQPMTFLRLLRDEIARRRGVIESKSFYNALIERSRNNPLSREEMDSLRLGELCQITTGDASACNDQILLIRSK